MKVAVAATAAQVPGWQRDAIALLRALAGIEVAVVDVAAAAVRPLRGLDARLAGPALATAPLSPSGQRFDGYDLVVNFTATPIAADARYGVWSYALGEAPSALPFAREVASGEPTVDIELRSARGENVSVLRRGRFPIPMWYPTLLRLALGEAGRWPATFVAALRDGIALPSESPAEARPRPRRSPGRLRFLAGLARRAVTGMRDAFFTVDQWNVGFANGDARTLLEGRPLDVRWLPSPPDRSFVADPFVVERDGLRVLFLEDFNYVRERGVIDALVLDANDRVVRRSRALDCAVHLSYPYPLELDGELYLVPESCAAGEVALYRCVAFPERWEREAALLPALDGVDTTIFEHEGRWWAFCTRPATGSNVALHAFHADSPRGAWSPHALNPIVVDVSRARPAGPTFRVDGALYRSGQDCTHTYGGAVVLARIDELTPVAYRESVVRRITAPPGRFPHGLHTISFARDTLVVDGKRTYRDPRNIGRAVRAFRGRFARLLARRRGSQKAPAA